MAAPVVARVLQELVMNISGIPGVERDTEEALENLETFNHDGGKMVFFVSGMLLVGFVLANMLHTLDISWFPESMAVVLLGAAVGFFLPMGNSSMSHWAIKHITIQEESIINEMTLNWFLLPMIIFEAGWSLKHRDFISQFPYILMFAIFGTLISMAVVGGLILASSDYHGITEPRVALCYAALISAVDPVATLATYGSLNVDPLLNTLVFGESVINDAVAIVLFKTLNEMPSGAWKEESQESLGMQLSSGVFGLLTCSLGLGVVLGAFYVLVIRFANLGHTTSLCALFVFFSCFFTYNLAEAVLHQSGIIAVLFSGMLMGGWATPHMTSEGAMFTSFLLKQMASIGDMIVFMFVGAAVVYVTKNGLVLGFMVCLYCLLGRACSTFPLGMLANFIKHHTHRDRPEETRHYLSWQHIVMMWHAGLRGGIALVLTLELGDWVDETDGPGTKEALRNCTLVVICLFMIVFGGSTKAMLTWLEIPVGARAKKLKHHKGSFKTFLSNIKQDFMIPVFLGSKDDEDEGDHGVVADIMQEADQAIGKRGSLAQTARRWAERYQLFGTYDPTHTDEVSRSKPRKSKSGVGIGGGHAHSVAEFEQSEFSEDLSTDSEGGTSS